MAKTLRNYLDEMGVNSGDDRSFSIVCENVVEMSVSRRYLEAEPMKQYLDMKVEYIEDEYINIYGKKTLRFWLTDLRPASTLLL